jgi:ParB/RepB/Spo0J family partition protein
VEQLRAHPGNVRTNLKLRDWFLSSVENNGVKVPLVVVRDEHGYKVVMGHRRLAAAEKAGLEKVPVFVLDPALREAGEDYIDMLIENAAEGREELTELEQADALFHAELAGMPRATVVKRSGRTKAEVEKAVSAAQSVGTTTRAALAQVSDYEFTTDVLAVLGEFDDDPEAVERLITAHTAGYFNHQVTRERDDREEAQARDARRAELAAAGVTLIEDADDLPTKAEWLEDLRDADGKEIDPQAHASCPGHLAAWDEDSGTPAAVEFFCADPKTHGHTTEEDDDQHGNGADDDGQSAPTTAAAKPGKEEMPHKLKVEGNAAYRAAGKTRREWLRTEFLSRKTAPKALAPFVTAQLLICPKPVQMWTGDVSRVALLAELLGHDKTDSAAGRAEWVPGNTTPGRLMLLNFAALAACWEKRIDQVQTWRHDKPQEDTEEIRADARVYLAFLGEMGYPPAPVEQAIISGEPYAPQDDELQDEDGDADGGNDA